jgi:hypothetical protein
MPGRGGAGFLAAHRAELLEAGPDSGQDLSRGMLRLGPDSMNELKDRMDPLLIEFYDRGRGRAIVLPVVAGRQAVTTSGLTGG